MASSLAIPFNRSNVVYFIIIPLFEFGTHDYYRQVEKKHRGTYITQTMTMTNPSVDATKLLKHICTHTADKMEENMNLLILGLEERNSTAIGSSQTFVLRSCRPLTAAPV